MNITKKDILLISYAPHQKEEAEELRLQLQPLCKKVITTPLGVVATRKEPQQQVTAMLDSLI